MKLMHSIKISVYLQQPSMMNFCCTCYMTTLHQVDATLQSILFTGDSNKSVDICHFVWHIL